MYKQLSTVLSNKWTVPVVVGVTSFTLGAVGGYFYGRRESVVRYDSNENSPVDVDNQLAFDFDEDEIATVTYIRDRLPGDIITEYADDEYSEFELDWDAELDLEEDELAWGEDIIRSNIFAGSDDEWDYEAEVNSRGSGPYIIHVDEFVANELDFTQDTMIYYEGDDILADEKDVPVYNYATSVGELKFGHGSKDPSLVYVRNEQQRIEWEIIKHIGSFEVEVRGLEIESDYESQELRHARSPQRFRMD